MRIALVVPHIFMHEDILPNVIFSPGNLAIDLVNGLNHLGHEVTFFSPGYKISNVNNINSDLEYFKWELGQRGDSYIDLLKKHPLVFISLAREAQAELISKAFEMANNDKFNLVHIYTNEEDLGLIFGKFCNKPVVYTHHDPFNFYSRYRSVFPKYKNNNLISISYAQRKGMPEDSNFVANIYHGINKNRFTFNSNPKKDYYAYFGRIVESKGVHLAIQAAKKAGIKLKIAGKHYAEGGNDKYWHEKVSQFIDNETVEYIGFLKTDEQKQEFLGNAKALFIPSIFEEPFGMVMIESLACGTPIIGLNSGAIPEVVQDSVNGFVADKVFNTEDKLDEEETVMNLIQSISKINSIDRKVCREDFEKRFTVERMFREHEKAYKSLLGI